MSSKTAKASRSKTQFLGVDTGGTFTDFFYFDGQTTAVHKVLSTPSAPERAILQGIHELKLSEAMGRGELLVVHGSTVATNAALERKGVKTAFVTNKGFADLLSLARQNRPHIYDIQPREDIEVVPRSWCFEVDCRRGSQGELLAPLLDEDLSQLRERVKKSGVEAVAVSLLFSYLNGDEERRIKAALGDDYFVCCSHEVLAESGEYERGMATWLNAWLGPKVEAYLKNLQAAVAPSSLGVMQSSGGTIDANQASRSAVNLLLSGPAGGLAAAKYISEQIAQPRLMTFDMGGTSSDVALIDGGIRLTNESTLGDFPVAVATVDMHTIGAGGGSLAYLDEAGALHVGPESSGASPGPACYGQGGTQPTVTDANALLGRIRPENFLGGAMALNLEASKRAFSELAGKLGVSAEQAAQGVVDLANEHMAAALRVISVQKGYDPKEFELCCFGGAGGLHVCALADALGVERITVPIHGGVLSAMGMLVAPRQRQLSQSLNRALAGLSMQNLESLFEPLSARGQAELLAEGVDGDSIEAIASVDCRYQGQSFYINLPLQAIDELAQAFHRAHKQAYGHELDLPIELVNVRLRLTAPAACSPLLASKDDESLQTIRSPSAFARLPEGERVPVWDRASMAVGEEHEGPLIICEPVATTWVAPNWSARIDRYGHLRLRKLPQR